MNVDGPITVFISK